MNWSKQKMSVFRANFWFGLDYYKQSFHKLLMQREIHLSEK